MLTQQGWREPSEYALSLTPVLAFLVALGWILLRLWDVTPWGIGRLSALMIALGCATFGWGVVLGFLIFDAADKLSTLLHLSAALTLCGIPVLLTGTMIQEKLAVTQATDNEQLGLWRTIGTGLALNGSGGDVRWFCGCAR